MSIDIAEAINRLDENEFFMITSPDQVNVVALYGKLDRYAEFLNADPEWSSLISMAVRPGSSLYWQVLEHSYFPPYSPREPYFQFVFTRWQSMVWTIGTIPTRSAFLLDLVAQKTNMRIANGVPTIISQEGQFTFPLRRAHTLENAPDSDLVQYKATEENLNRIMNGEITLDEMCENVRHAAKESFREEHRQLNLFLRSKGLDEILP